MKRFFPTLAFLLLAWNVEAADRYFSTTGSGSLCTTGSPCPIATAFSGGSPGDRYLGKTGAYNITGQAMPPSGTSWSSPTTITRDGAAVVSFVGETGIVNRSYIILDGLNFNGSSVAQTISMGGGTHHIRIINNDIGGANTSSSVFGVIDSPGTGDLGFNEVINNVFHNYGNEFSHHAIYFGTPSNIIEYNDFSFIAGACVHLYTGSGNDTDTSNNKVRFNTCRDSNGTNTGGTSAAGIVAWDGSNTEIYANLFRNLDGSAGNIRGTAVKFNNNTVRRVTEYAIGVGAVGGGGHSIRNNIFWEICFGDPSCGGWPNRIYGPGDTSSGSTKSNNLCEAPESGCSVLADPLFVSTTDLHLQSASPAIGAGANLGPPYDVDPDGISRVVPWDMGAFAFAVAGGSSPTIVITAPTLNSSYAVTSSTLNLSGSASDDVAVTSVTWSSTACGSGTATGTTSWSISLIGLPLGPCVITVTAHDAGGRTGTDILTVVRVNPQLVLAMAMDEGSGSAVADTSGNSNNGTISNATWTTAGRFGNALVFDGTGDVVTVADSNSLDLVMFTFEAWVFPTTVSTGFGAILAKASASVYYLYASVAGYCGDGAILAGYYSVAGGTSSDGCYATPLPINAWSHVSATYDSANIKIYVNGLLVSTTAAGGNIAASTGNLTIGLSEFGEGFVGRLDEMRIHNHDIGAAQIALEMVTPITTIGVNPPIKVQVSSAAIKCAALPACLKLSGQ